MRRLALSLLVAASFVLLLLAAPGYGGEPSGALAAFGNSRTWSDATGRFKIDAKLQFADKGTVKLAKSDGRFVSVPLAKLSEPDQAFVNAFLKAEEALGAPATEPADNPFAGGERPSQPAGSSAAVPPAVSGSNSIEKRKSFATGFRPLTITAKSPFWSAAEPRPFPKLQIEDNLIQHSITKPFFAKLQILTGGVSATTVLNVYQQGRTPAESYSRFAFIGASSGHSSSVFEHPDPLKLMAISPDATRLAAVRVVGFDKGSDLVIFKVESGALVPEFEFTAGGGSWDELHWVAFLPNNRLATISQKHDFTIWDLGNGPGPKALARGSTGGALKGDITAAGELIALPVGNSIAVVETSAGKLVGWIDNERKVESVAFSDNGKYLAAYAPFNVTLYRTSDGQAEKTIAVSESNANIPLRWLDDQLMVGQIVYDVGRALPLWTYETGGASQTTLGGHLFCAFGGDNKTTLAILRLPHDEALRAASGADPKDIYAVVPGDEVSVQFDFGAAPADAQKKIRQAVENKVAQLGWNLNPASPTKIEVKLTQGKKETVEYFTRRGFGPFFGPPGFGPRPSGPSEKVKFNPWRHSLVITSGGQKLFENTYNRTAPQVLQTKDGESTQQAVNRYVQPSPDHFSRLAIPPHLPKPAYQGGLGRSKVTATGIQ